MSALVVARDLAVGYGEGSVAKGIDLTVHPGEVVALLGPNGAGKTTTMLTLAGELAPQGGEVSLSFCRPSAPLYRRARQGLAFVTEDRSVFMNMTVAQNLRVGRCDVDAAVAVFPELRALLNRTAGLLSGGEQQMLTLGRALARLPKLFFGDELSLGLAPLVVGRLLEAVRRAADGGVGCLLIEQHVHRVLEIADRVYLLNHGSVEFSGTAEEARQQLVKIEGSYLSRNRSRGGILAE
jgi:ABC-type branched-subunit amino acid transport system ATPase component